MAVKLTKKDEAVILLRDACKEFVRKVEAGEARSTRSYNQMKTALAAFQGACDGCEGQCGTCVLDMGVK